MHNCSRLRFDAKDNPVNITSCSYFYLHVKIYYGNSTNQVIIVAGSESV